MYHGEQPRGALLGVLHRLELLLGRGQRVGLGQRAVDGGPGLGHFVALQAGHLLEHVEQVLVHLGVPH